MEVLSQEAGMGFCKKMTKKHDISIILAPFGLGGPNDAPKGGPSAVMKNGLGGDLTELGFNVKVISPSKLKFRKSNTKNRIKNIEAIFKFNKWLTEVVAGELQRGSIPLTIGGDHSLAIGTIAGVHDVLNNFGVLWIDRHFDAHSPKNTPSWRAHGMPTAFAIGDKKYDPHPDFQKLLTIGENKKLPKVKPQNFVYFGIGEKSFTKPKTKWYLMEDIDNFGIKKVIDDAISYLLKRVKYIYVAWDIDAMNVTGTGTSGDEQLTLREGLVISRAINKRIRQAGRLAGLEMMEIAPKLERKDLRGQTVNWTCELTLAIFGGNLFNNYSRMTRNINMHATD